MCSLGIHIAPYKLHTFSVYRSEGHLWCIKKLILRLDLCHWLLLYFAGIGGDKVVRIDFNNINDKIIYEAFHVEGNEAEALNDSYLELFELIGRDAMLKLFTHFHGDKIDCPMRLYRPEFIADLAKGETDRRERAKIARAGGYSARVIEGLLSKRRKENETE